MLRCLLLLLTLLSSTSLAHAQSWAPPPAVTFNQRQLALPKELAMRVQLLESDFMLMRAENRGRDWVLAGLMVTGATMIGFGGAYAHEVGAILLPIGAIALMRGLIGITLQPDPRPAANTYLSMPMLTANMVRERIQFGERALYEQARRERRARIFDGVFSTLVSSSYVPIDFALQRSQDPHYEFKHDSYGFALLALSLVSVAATLVDVFQPTANERRAQEYRELVEQTEHTQPGALQRLRDSLSLRGGRGQLGMGMQLRF